MNRKNLLSPEQRLFFEQILSVSDALSLGFKENLKRSVSFGDLFVDRWERANKLNFGANSNIYDSSLVIGDVKIGSNCWVGPFTILDGSGGLIIGDYSTISAGVHIYSHDNVKNTLTSGLHEIERKKVEIGSNTYIGPNSIISKGVSIGNFCVIGASSFVNKSFPDNTIIAGTPAKIIGIIKIEFDSVKFEYIK